MNPSESSPGSRGSTRPDRAAAILAAARAIAESEGWPAVTVRRLAAAIGYSQPVLYQHFAKGRPEIIAAVARSGFAQLEEIVGSAAGAVTTGSAAGATTAENGTLAAVARAYLTFAREHGALYEAMFEMPSLNRFASDETPAELRSAFGAVAALFGTGPDADTRAELLWSMLHGVAVLERDDRLPAERREARIAEIARIFG